MKIDGIAVTGLGMHSTLGAVVQACAAARAGITRPAEVELAVCTSDDVEPLNAAGHPCRDAASFQGLGRLGLLASGALDDLTSRGELPDSNRTRVHLIVNLPDPFTRPLLGDQLGGMERSVSAAELGEAFGEVLRRVLPPRLANAEVAMHSDGHAGVIAGVQLATEMLINGRSDCCIVGGVDSYIDLESLEWLAGTGRLKTPDLAVGLAPGEGAAFVVLERVQDAERRGAPMHAKLGSIAVDEVEYEFGDEEIAPHGRELVDAMETALNDAGSRGRSVELVVQDRNGTNARAMEWGFVLQACAARNLGVGDAKTFLPATSFGDVGAAWSAFAICLGTRTLQRAMRRGPVLIAAASEDGLRGALVLTA